MLDNLKIDSRSEQSTFSVDVVAGKDKQRYEIPLTKATADKISDYVSRNATRFNIYQVAAVGLLAAALVVCIVPSSFSIMSVSVASSAFNGSRLVTEWVMSRAIIMAVLGTVITVGLSSIIGGLAAEYWKDGMEVNRKSLFSSMKHDQIIDFCKKVGITIDDLFSSLKGQLVMKKEKKKLNIETIKMIFDLDTGKKERTKAIILEAVRSYPEIWEELQSVMMEERYKGFCDVRSPLYDQKFEEALRKTLMAHSKIATADPVYSVLDVTQQNLYPRVPPLNPRLAALLTVKA